MLEPEPNVESGRVAPAGCGMLGPEQTERLTVMVRDHFRTVWRTARRMGLPPLRADEAAQEVFVMAARKLAQIELGAERSYLVSVAVRIAANWRRARSGRVELADEQSMCEGADPAPPADELIDRKRLRLVLDQALEKLPPELRSVFVLFELEGFSGPEIAETLALPAGTVASRLRKAREMFHAELMRERARRALRGGTP
jgi:RNA polymerase sigma-70 factor (ECF subfamily)